MSEALVYSLLYAAGIAHLAPWIRQREQVWLVASGGLLIGLCGYVISAIVLSTLQIFDPVFSLAVLSITGLTVAVVYRANLVNHILPLLTGLLAVFSLGWFFAANTYINASYDSYQLIIIGQQIALEGGFTNETEARLASWGSFLPLGHTLAIALDKDLLGALHPTTSAIGLWTLAVASFYTAKQYLNNVGSLVLTAGAITFLVSSFFVLFQASYIHNSLLATAYLALALHAMLQWGQHQAPLYPIVAGIGFLAFALLRVEAPIFTAVFIACLYPLVNQPNSGYLRLVVAITLAIGAWYLYLALVIGGGSDILTPSRVAIVMAPLVGWALLVSLSSAQLGTRLGLKMIANNGWWLLPATAALVTIVAGIVMTDHLTHSATSIQTNLFEQGRWGYLWLGYALAIALIITAPMDRQTKYLLAAAATFFLGVLLLSLGRKPYRVGWGDSGNRIITQSIVVITLAVVGGIAHRLKQTNTNTITNAAKQDGSAWLYTPGILLCGLVVALYNPAAGLLRAPQNLLTKAMVVKQPAWSRGHELNISLQTSASSSYAASALSGPATIEFELADSVTEGIIRVHEYHADLAMQEYIWSVATESGDWVRVSEHGTANANERPVTYLDPTHYCFSFAQPTTKLRLQFLKGKDQNRILIKHIALTKTNQSSGYLRSLKPNQQAQCNPG